MALPAGYSSEEEWDSGDELSFGANICKSVRNHDNENVPVNQNQDLINAIMSRKYDEAQRLLENGADVNYKPNSNWSSLMHAAFLGDIKLIELLLKYGADPNIHVKMTTPLICLSNSSNFDEDQLLQCLNLLLASGAKIDVYDAHRVTPLMYAAQRGHIQLVSRLLELGIDLEISDCIKRWTAIFYAVNSGNINLVQLLIGEGANINLEDTSGQTLYDLASTRNFNDIANILIPHEENYDSELTEEKSNYQFVMSEMPNYKLSHFSGFCQDVINIVTAVGMNKIEKLFREKSIGYGQFLIFTESDWEKVGVNMSFDRKILTTFAKDIIKKKWSHEAVIRDKDNINCFFTIDKILCNNVRIIHILVATYHVCHRELLNCDQISDQHLFKEKLNNCLHEVKMLRENINFLKYWIDKFGKHYEKFPVDYIEPNSHNSYLQCYYKYGTITCLVVAVIGFHFLLKNRNFLLDGYLKFLKRS